MDAPLRIAFFSPPFASHLALHTALAERLVARGHECVLVHHEDVGLPRGSSLQLEAVSADWSPQGVIAHARKPGLPFGVLRTVRDMAAMTQTLCREAPERLRRLGVDGVVVDQAESAGGIVAEALGLPFASVAAAVPINPDPTLPLPVLPWPWDPSEAGLKRNRGGERVAAFLTRRLDGVIAEEAARLGAAPKRGPTDCLSPLADISQLVPGLDFPRSALPGHFHYVGPIRGSTSGAVTPLPVPDKRKPLVFASFGTLQGHRVRCFRKLARACREAGAQLLLAHCGALDARKANSVGADWVVDRVDQRAAVALADLVVTHAGLNTVLDALEAEKPMLCVPLAFDQPGVAARVARVGAGEVLKERASAQAIREAVTRLLASNEAKRAAAGLAREIRASGGVGAACDIIEQALITRRPVLREGVARNAA
ncbi:MAG: zeaxanthin glucosyltransferase [Mesorhizobium amorphae]|nr:MAG: zeaxanthin glucosyltransferase [Mesorhizobium amorphae]